MKVPTPLVRLGTIVFWSLAVIPIHEFGHFVVYRAAGYAVRITLQSVTPIGRVDPTLGHWAMMAGPLLSWIAAVACIVIAARRPGFTWAMAAFANASLRLFPTVMDLLRAFHGAPPFSDEGDVALAFTTSPWGRAAIVLVATAISSLLTVLAARRFRFARWAVLKSAGIYVLSLAVGIAVVIADELLRR